MKLKKIITTALVASTLAASITSCTTFGNVMNHKDLKVESKMSETVFLDPVKQSNKVVLISVKNTSGTDVVNLTDDITKQLEANGWKVTDDPDKAFYMIQVNILQAGEAKNPQDVMNSIGSGFGSVISGGLIGTATGLVTNDFRTGSMVGIGAGVGDAIGAALTKDVAFSVITDIQVSQKVDGKVSEVTQASLADGNSTNTAQTYTVEGNWLKHRIRIGTVADQMNLTMEKALPEIEKQLSSQIVGILK